MEVLDLTISNHFNLNVLCSSKQKVLEPVLVICDVILNINKLQHPK